MIRYLAILIVLLAAACIGAAEILLMKDNNRKDKALENIASHYFTDDMQTAFSRTIANRLNLTSVAGVQIDAITPQANGVKVRVNVSVGLSSGLALTRQSILAAIGTPSSAGPSFVEDLKANAMDISAATKDAFANVQVTSPDVSIQCGLSSPTPTYATTPNCPFNNVTNLPVTACCGGVVNVALDPSVTSIAANAFTGCNSLVSFNASAAKSIGSYAFAGCNRLTTFNAPLLTQIANSGFEACPSLTTFTADALSSISDNAFLACTSILSFNAPALISIGQHVFQSCSSLTSFTPPALTTIGGAAFQFCTALTSFNAPNVTSIGGSAFAYCASLDTFYAPALTSIVSGAFFTCPSLTTFTASPSLSAGVNAFQFSNNLNCAQVTPRSKGIGFC